MIHRKRASYFVWVAVVGILFVMMATGQIARVDFDSLHAVRDTEDEALQSGQLVALHLRCTRVPIDPTGSVKTRRYSRVIRVVESRFEDATDLDCVLVRR